MGFLIEDLVSGVKSRSFVPVSQSTFVDPDSFISLLDSELKIKLVADIIGAREDYFLTSKVVPLVAGQSRYTIPARAVGTSFKALFRKTPQNQSILLDRIDLERVQDFSGGTGSPTKFIFEGDEIQVFPTPVSSGDVLDFRYYARPNSLCATTSCAKITSLSSLAGTTTLTVDTDLTASLLVGSKIDLLSATPPFLLWADHVVVTNITTSTVSVATSDISNEVLEVEPQIGDYVCPAGFSNIPMIPLELQPVLEQMAVCRALRAIGALERYKAENEELKEMRAEALKLIRNRSEISPRKVIARNAPLGAYK